MNRRSIKHFSPLILGCIILVLVFITFLNIESGFASAYSFEDDKVISGEFEEDSVVVTLDETISSINKVHNISFFKGVEIDRIVDLTKRDNFKSVTNGFKQILQVYLKQPSRENVIKAINILKTLEGVYNVEPNYVESLEFSPNDTEYRKNKMWGLNGTNGINMPAAWDITKGSQKVRVGIIDTGIAYHSDLNNNLKTGYDFYNKNSNTTDVTHSHGTHVAGTIGAVGNNNLGIVGVNLNVSLVPLQASNEQDEFYHTTVVNAIEWATDQWGTENQIDIINYSVSGYGTSTTVLEAISHFPGLFVWSAGNNNADVDSDIKDNANYDFDLPNLISVGAINSNNERATGWGTDGTLGSNYSSSYDAITVYAPGDNILSTISGNNYAYWSGTSMAAPHVTGVAALLLSVNPSLSAADLKKAIKNGSDIISINIPSNNGGTEIRQVRKLNADKTLRHSVFNVTALNDETLRVDGLKYSYSGALEMPSIINGKRVVEIGDRAFENKTGLTEIICPSSIRSIGNNAFQNCSLLSHVEWNSDYENESQLTLIGNSAFYNCTSLINVYIPDSLQSIGANAFENSSIKTINFDSSYSQLKEVGNSAFNKSQLLAFYAPESLCTIGANAFSECESLYRVDISDTQLTTIANGTFFNCSDLRSIRLPNTIQEIGYNAFENCIKMASVYCSNNSQLKRINNSAFANCKILKNFDTSNLLNYIGDYAFSGCEELLSFVLPNSVNIIGSKSFQNCAKLTFYTAKANAPTGWAGGWNSLNRPIVLSCNLATNIPYVISFNKSASNPFNINAVNGVSVPFREDYTFNGWCTLADCSDTPYTDLKSAPNGTLYAKWTKNDDSCIAEGSLITLADGRQVAVEELTGDEQLLVWNLQTGRFDVAPIMFIDSEIRAEYEIIKLRFADGTAVKVIDEHGFWDVDLNRYVYLRNDAAKYIGHRFNKQTVDGEGNMIWTSVELVGVDVYKEVTTAWSPVTSGHLCYYVNGMLSMPGGIEGLFNIFEVDGEAMKYDAEAFAEDIATYGLFSYEEFAALVPVSQEVFEVFGGQYLKIAIGKGLITVDKLNALAERYAKYF